MARHPYLTPPMKPPTLLFLLIIFLALIPSVCPAQTMGGAPSASQYPTRDEQTILSLHSDWLFDRKVFGDHSPSADLAYKKLVTKLEHYERENCKEQMNGNWKFQELGDEINISWNDQHKVFVGKLTRIVIFQKEWVSIGHILFKVYFTKNWAQGVTTAPMTLNDLRKSKNCWRRPLEGPEYSFKRQGNQIVPTTQTITIHPTSRSSMIYQTGKKNYTLILLNPEYVPWE